MTKKAVQPDEWKTKPLPDRFSVIKLDREFSAADMESIQAGLLPRAMEDKWFIYWKDGRLYFHRSWTGLCIFVASFVEEDGSFRMVEARVNRDPEQYSATSYSRDAEMISYLIDVLLLRRRADFPSRFDNPETAAVEEWSLVGRAMLGQGPKPGARPEKHPSARPIAPPAGRPEQTRVQK